MCLPGGVCPGGCLLAGRGGVWGGSASVHAGICLPRGSLLQCMLGYVCPAGGGVCPSACWNTHPPVNRMTNKQG